MHRYYKTLIVAAIVVLTLGLMVLDRTNITPGEAPESSEKGASQLAPDVTFALLEGGTVALHSLAGHSVLLHFWASWCVPCREEFSGLMKRMAEDKGDTVLLAVSGDGDAKDAERFLAPYKRDFKSLFSSGKVMIGIDPKHELIEGVFQTFKYPETIIIAPDLSMKRKIVGAFKE